jgi:PIN domain nuclease of toxin-antitoxin system
VGVALPSYLIDTHALLWSFGSPELLGARARRIIENRSNQILVSAACGWEIATKFRLGKLPSAEDLVENFDDYLLQVGFEAFSISLQHALRAGKLPGAHKDPFDRMLISQALEENIAVISTDHIFDEYRVQRLW